jgi:hypothetical protein
MKRPEQAVGQAGSGLFLGEGENQADKRNLSKFTATWGESLRLFWLFDTDLFVLFSFVD